MKKSPQTKPDQPLTVRPLDLHELRQVVGGVLKQKVVEHAVGDMH